jgi:SpoVK/Ycf46/Vps4 family AAA+-type ATPase
MSVTQVKPAFTFADLVLPSEVVDELRALLEEEPYSDVLRGHGIPVRSRVLLHGPSGCGKTSIAHALAHALEIPLAIAPLAEQFGGTMGSSEKSVAAVLQFAATNRAVLLLDEFDSIATGRLTEVDSAADHVVNRVVNTLLTELDAKPPLGLIVACTNLFRSVDPAVIRRFDLVLEIPAATQESLRVIAERILGGRWGLSATDVLRYASTPSAVKKRAYDALRRKVIELKKAEEATTMPLFTSGPEAARHIKERIRAQGVSQ